MNNHRHFITQAVLAFTFGITVGNLIAAEQNGGEVYEDTVNEHVVLNPSTDGRYHTCGYITEDGVTEHLDAYVERCGDTTYASDTPTNSLVQCVPGEVWYPNSFADDEVTPAELECVDPRNGGLP